MSNSVILTFANREVVTRSDLVSSLIERIRRALGPIPVALTRISGNFDWTGRVIEDLRNPLDARNFLQAMLFNDQPPLTSPIKRAILDDDPNHIDQLFKEELVNPFTKDNASSLLYVAIANSKKASTQKLIELGCELGEHELALLQIRALRSQTVKETLQLLEPDDQSVMTLSNLSTLIGR